MNILNQKGNASVVVIFILIVIFSIYLAGGPGLLLSGETPKPEIPISGTLPGGNASPIASPSASPISSLSATIAPSPTR